MFKLLRSVPIFYMHLSRVYHMELCQEMVKFEMTNEPGHEISNNVVCATRKASDQPVHMRSLIRAFASRLHIL